jgi:hypothetical protein
MQAILNKLYSRNFAFGPHALTERFHGGQFIIDHLSLETGLFEYSNMSQCHPNSMGVCRSLIGQKLAFSTWQALSQKKQLGRHMFQLAVGVTICSLGTVQARLVSIQLSSRSGYLGC